MIESGKKASLLLFLMLCSHFLSLNIIDSTRFGNFLNYIVVSILVIFFIANKNKVPECKGVFTCYGIFIIINIISSYVYRGQTFLQTFFASHEIFEIYFFFFIVSVRPNIETMKSFLLVTIFIVTVAYYYQVAVYPTAIFATSDAGWVTNLSYSYRNIIVGCQHIVTLGAFYFFNKYLHKKSFTSLLLALIFVTPLFIRSMRIAFAGFIIGLCFLFLSQKRKSLSTFFRISFLIAIIIAAFSIMYSVNPIVKESTDLLVEKIQIGDQNLGNEDYSRTISLTFHFTEFFNSPIEYIFGSGMPWAGSSYGEYVASLHKDYTINYVDWGLLGLSWYLGIPAVLCLLYLFYRAVVAKIPYGYKYLSAWFLYGLIFSATDPETYQTHAMLVEAMALYMIYLLDPQFLKWRRTHE